MYEEGKTTTVLKVQYAQQNLILDYIVINPVGGFCA